MSGNPPGAEYVAEQIRARNTPLGEGSADPGYSLDMRALRTQVMSLPLAVAVLAVALAYPLSGCTSDSGPSTDGPLRGGAYGLSKGGGVCTPARVGQPRTFGIERFTNHGYSTVVLDRVALLHPRNERVIGSYAVPGESLIGVVAWPPKYAGIPSAWKHRQPVHGFRLAPGKTFNMALGVVAAALGRASSQGMRIYYRDSAASYVTRSDFAMIIAVDKLGC